MARILSQILAESAYYFAEHDAVVFGSEKVSYLELDEQSNQLANALKNNGVQRGERIGIYLNKSIRSVISIFAILKADAVCVPLDPTGPMNRIAYIIDDCQIKCLITQSNMKRGLAGIVSRQSSLTHAVFTSAEVVTDEAGNLVTISWDQVASQAKSAPLLSSIDADLAYILYTSGSTGKPKGVMISHLNVLSFLDWAGNYFGINSSDRVASHAPLHFDLSIFDLFVTIKCGATVCFVPSEISFLPTDLARFISEQRISVWQSVPSALVLLSNCGQLGNWNLDYLRMVLFAGEIFPVKVLRELMLQIPQARYYNIYGATEINDVTCYHVKELPSGSSVPIGTACANTEVFAIDEQGQLVTKAGIIGEMYVRGSIVSKGYWGNTETTQTRFVQNPLQSRFHDPVYRTGDLVELDQEGNYRYIGRSDSQVKIRGYRVGLDEVEEAVLRYPGIDEVSVIALNNIEKSQFLKAFIVAKKGTIIDESGLKKHFLSCLPKYMLPEAIELCEFLPKTSTGKVDMQKLKGTRHSESALL
jgi:amino acid adenylation domain-containing protein